MPVPAQLNGETCGDCTSALQDDDIEEGHLEAVLLSLPIAHAVTTCNKIRDCYTLQEHLQFLRRRRLCCMLWLEPKVRDIARHRSYSWSPQA